MNKFRCLWISLIYGKKVKLPHRKIIIGNGKININKGFCCRDSVLFNVTGGEISIGENTFINDGCKFNARKKISIGKNCMLGQNVLIYDHDHDYHTLENMHEGFIVDDIIIGDDVWIGSNVTILRGSQIGDGCVIGAGTVIKNKIEPGTMVYSDKNMVIKKIR